MFEMISLGFLFPVFREKLLEKVLTEGRLRQHDAMIIINSNVTKVLI